MASWLKRLQVSVAIDGGGIETNMGKLQGVLLNKCEEEEASVSRDILGDDQPERLSWTNQSGDFRSWSCFANTTIFGSAARIMFPLHAHPSRSTLSHPDTVRHSALVAPYDDTHMQPPGSLCGTSQVRQRCPSAIFYKPAVQLLKHVSSPHMHDGRNAK